MTLSAENIAQRVLDQATRGAEAAEVLMQESESRSVHFENNALKSVNTKAVRGVGLRVIREGRVGFACTNDMGALDEVVANALESAQFGEEAKFAFPASPGDAQVRIFDQAAADVTMEQAAETMRGGVERILAENPDAKCSGGVNRGVGRTVICNSAGLCVNEESTSFGVGIDAFLVKGESFLWVDEGEDSARYVDNMATHAAKVNEWIRRCAKETHLGEEKMPVVFTPRALDILLGSFASNINGKLVHKGASILAGRIGDRILDPRVTLTDDPLVDYASGSYACDAEGVPATVKAIFENGVLKRYLYDLQTAALMNAAPTGNGLRGYSAQPRPGISNLRMLPGDTPVKELMAGVKRGLLIDQALGAGQSNVLAGEFSVNVELGFLVENGEIVGRVKDCMLAGNAFDAFNAIRAISRETEWHGSVDLPTVCFESLSVVGRAE